VVVTSAVVNTKVKLWLPFVPKVKPEECVPTPEFPAVSLPDPCVVPSVLPLMPPVLLLEV